MTSDDHSQADSVSLEFCEAVEPICLRFEDAWRRGEQPNIVEYLADYQGVERLWLLRQLLRVEIEYCHRAGKVPVADDYQKRFPEHSDLISDVFTELSNKFKNEPADTVSWRGDAHFETEGDPFATTAGKVPTPRPLQIGRYEIQRQLGSGAFGIVYLAFDPELDRQVAIKVSIDDQFETDEEAEPFLSEARKAGSLKHPAIVTVYDIGKTESGSRFIVMEYIDGTTLKDLLNDGPIPTERVVDLMSQIADAMAVAHREDLVHRDLKPSNILLDTKGAPHVADFGLAVHEDEQRDLAGQRAGTPDYMAPEQIRGEVQRLDGRTDIWALGVILYEMLTGRRPFRGKGFSDVADDILHREPKPPRQIDDDIPPELERICLKCCAKDMTDRYSSATDLAKELHELLPPSDQKSADGLLSKKPSTTKVNVTFGPLGLFLGGVIATALLVTVGFFWISSTDPSIGDTPNGSKHGRNVLRDTIDVLVWDPNDEDRRRLRLQDIGALPLRANDQIRVEAILKKPAYVYIVWIDTNGEAFPVYPWKPGDWTDRPSTESPTDHVSLPEQADRGWPMQGAEGMETLMLLARATPLPSGVDLRQLLAGLPKQTNRNETSLVWFADGEVVIEDQTRAPIFGNDQQIDDPILQTQRTIQEKLSPHFNKIRAVSFANRGE